MPGSENVRWSLNWRERAFEFVKGKKQVLIIVLVCVGLLMILLASASSDDVPPQETTLSEYKAELEREMEDVCSSVMGVGKCRVVITFERGAENTYKGSNLIESKPPRVMGVSVVCRGASSDRVRAELTEMLSALFDIGKNRIAVLQLEN